jgi:hypothetical protein
VYVRSPEGFSMRAGVQLCRQSYVRPALTNLGRRKPRCLGSAYGERALAGKANNATGAASVVLGAPVAVVFRHLGCGCSLDWTLRTQRRSSFWMMVVNGLGRSANDDRSISKGGVKRRIMQPAPLVVRGTLVSGHAGRSR